MRHLHLVDWHGSCGVPACVRQRVCIKGMGWWWVYGLKVHMDIVNSVIYPHRKWCQKYFMNLVKANLFPICSTALQSSRENKPRPQLPSQVITTSCNFILFLAYFQNDRIHEDLGWHTWYSRVAQSSFRIKHFNSPRLRGTLVAQPVYVHTTFSWSEFWPLYWHPISFLYLHQAM